MRPHLCHVFSTFATGGPEVRTAVLMNESNGEFRHTVASLSGDVGCRSRIQPNVDVRFIEAPRRDGRIGYMFALARMLKELDPDLVLTYGWGATDGVLAAQLSGFRRLIHAEDGFLPDEARRQKLRRLLARRVILRAPARVVCPSRTLLNIANNIWRLPRHKVSYIPNGVDAARFAPCSHQVTAAARERLGCSPSETVIGTVGQLRADKNHARLIRVFASVAARRNVKLLIVGGGPLRDSLDSHVREFGIEKRVIFAGETRDPVQYYQAMDIFALSSDTEQMPIAILEAMSMQLPVVSTDVGDVREMVDSENCRFVVRPENEDGFVRALAQLVDDVPSRAALGRANREKCLRDYEVGVMVQTYIRLYREILKLGRR